MSQTHTAQHLPHSTVGMTIPLLSRSVSKVCVSSTLRRVSSDAGIGSQIVRETGGNSPFSWRD